MKSELQETKKPPTRCYIFIARLIIRRSRAAPGVGVFGAAESLMSTLISVCVCVCVCRHNRCMLIIYGSDSGSANGRYTCSRIFVNHRCFSGPYLNKGRIAELPQAVGPGKCTLVLKEVG